MRFRVMTKSYGQAQAQNSSEGIMNFTFQEDW